MITDLTQLTDVNRVTRHRAIDAVQHRRQRGTVSPEDCAAFIAGINLKFGLQPVQTATDIVKIGSTFGKLTVCDFDKNGYGQTVANCRCECGNICTVNISKLASSHTKSCGCLRSEKGYVYGTGDAVIASIKATYKAVAKQKNLDFKLDHHAIRTLVLAPCAYCGIEPYRVWNILKKSGKIDSLTCNGIDRVNNELGYILSNVVSCCPRCNYAKRDMPLQEFAAWAIRLSEHLRKHVVSVSNDTIVETTQTTTNKGVTT